MIKRILEKWFGLTPIQCESCEFLSRQLEKSERERTELLNRLFDKNKPDPVPQTPTEDHVPIQPQFIPWRVKQQMLEAEDRRAAQLMRDKQKEIANLEKEIGIGAGDAIQK